MRTRSVTYTRQRKKKTFRIAKGYYSKKRNNWRMVIQQVEKSLKHAYRDRKDRKGNFRKLWITRINTLSRESGLSYSRLIAGLRMAGVQINRKMLADMVVQDADSFRSIVDVAKTALGQQPKGA